MPLSDAAAPPISAADNANPTVLKGWAGGPGVTARMLRADRLEVLRDALARHRRVVHANGAIPRGMGRSYGDAAQLADGLVLDTTALKGFRLDPDTGTVTAQAGTTVGELLFSLVPAGWMVPVVPGTQHVTIGGAIASDIHGKNHGTVGTFGSHVTGLSLLTGTGDLLELEPGSPDGLFETTLGGMGLTGVIVSANIRMRPISSPLVSVDTDRVDDLDGVLSALSNSGGPHRVAWLDLLGAPLARGVVTRADHIDRSDMPPGVRGQATVAARAKVPAAWPAGLLQPSTVRLFNELRFRRSPRHERSHPEGLGTHMFPLDALDAWPRLYGPGGFVQYQLVVPPGRERTLQAVIEHLRRARVPCYLAVLKDFGPANDAPLSFPIAGWTLALDLPRAAPGLEAALRRCDELVAEAEGRVYLSKDSRLEPDMVKAMYPRLEEWRATRERSDPDSMWRSDLALRTGLIPTERP